MSDLPRPDPTPFDFGWKPKPNGYVWWYLDAISDDGRFGLVMIMFLGSVFSPRYARARRTQAHAESSRGADPLEHAAINFALYPIGPDARRERAKLWAFNEALPVTRGPGRLEIGGTSIHWEGDRETLVVNLDEPSTRFFGRRGSALRGQIRLRPSAVFAPRIELDPWRDHARHRWYPVAPHARVELELEQPALRFSGVGYHDVNEGDEGLEQGFHAWNWSCARFGTQTMIAYDVLGPGGQDRARAWRFEPENGTIETLPPSALGPTLALPPSRWRVPRAIRTDAGTRPRLVHTLEDTPFYSRNLVELEFEGKAAQAVHESVDLRRYAASWVQFLLPFKITTSSTEP